MPKICLPPTITKLFLRGIKSGEINVLDLADISSAERRSFFETKLGIPESSAREINSMFESKLLLKNQEQGLIAWIKSVGNLKKETQRQLIDKVEKLDHILSVSEKDSFLEDLAAKKLGTDVSFEEAQAISDLASEYTKAENKLNPDGETFPTEGDRLAYGRAKVALDDYVGELKNRTKELTLEDFKKEPGRSTVKSVSEFAGLAKSLKASFDNSVIGRQGLKVLFTNPRIWLKNAKQSFVDMYRTYGGKDVMSEIRADVASRPNAINGMYRREKLAVGVTEEAFPTHLPAKIPVLGKAFKASENAFTGFQYRTRADLFDKYLEIANKSGADMAGIGRVANSLTGRGHLGISEPVANTLNNIFFSPRMLKANIDTLTAHTFDKGISPFARKQAAINLVKVVAGVAAILTIANAVDPGSVEEDPRSSDFGKIKVGNTRFDVSGGMSSIVTLAFRIARASKKSSTTGKISKLDTGKFGAPTTGETISDFFTNKLSPIATVVNDMFIRKHDFAGNKPTLGSTAKNLLAPLPYTTFEELSNDPNSANILVSMIADALGISVNTYGPTPKKKTIKN